MHSLANFVLLSYAYFFIKEFSHKFKLAFCSLSCLKCHFRVISSSFLLLLLLHYNHRLLTISSSFHHHPHPRQTFFFQHLVRVLLNLSLHLSLHQKAFQCHSFHSSHRLSSKRTNLHHSFFHPKQQQAFLPTLSLPTTRSMRLTTIHNPSD